MKSLAEIFYDAIQADETLMQSIGGRVKATCFEIPPDELDNTPVPNIIITSDGFVNQATTKDCLWEVGEDNQQASLDIAAASHADVEQLVKDVRRAIEQHIATMYNQGQQIPELVPGYPSSDGIAWDWMKPCYYTVIKYQCTMPTDLYDNEQESN